MYLYVYYNCFGVAKVLFFNEIGKYIWQIFKGNRHYAFPITIDHEIKKYFCI